MSIQTTAQVSQVSSFCHNNNYSRAPTPTARVTGMSTPYVCNASDPNASRNSMRTDSFCLDRQYSPTNRSRQGSLPDMIRSADSPTGEEMMPAGTEHHTHVKPTLPEEQSATVTINTDVTPSPNKGGADQNTTWSLSERLLRYNKPTRGVLFRDWYMFHFCNDRDVEFLRSVQRIGHPFEKVLTIYFKIWSLTGEAEFYILFLPTLAQMGYVHLAVLLASLLCFSQFITGSMKDCVCAPRPPCPPLELRGSVSTHEKEYGFPSTHSSHSTVFAFFIYVCFTHMCPGHAFLIWCIAMFFLVNVCFSRLYLGMHWLADLVSGMLTGVVVILIHIGFVFRWEKNVFVAHTTPSVLHFIAPMVLLYLVSVFHATPHDDCPCYIDSVRFTSALAGSFIGILCFRGLTGFPAARGMPDHVSTVLTDKLFYIQWVVGMFIIVAFKEVSSLAAPLVLKPLFLFITGAYAHKLPKTVRVPYIFLCRFFGFFAANNNVSNVESSFNDVSYFNTNGRQEEHKVKTREASPISRTVSPVAGAGNGTPSVEKSDGFASAMQVWSYLTHKHWTLWEVHQRSVSYFFTGFAVCFVVPVIQRYVFGVEHNKKITPDLEF
ncbi:PAP2 superfamily, putative [Angomonas deanei]|uniref:PAP2 superfamily, putative n=1 Tax=Angomonas deanei TaxID=59799 RepID=A0A7G2CBS5_9TRYP|nr:PAP2 superfamily, putative [Angomonas deanei]